MNYYKATCTAITVMILLPSLFWIVLEIRTIIKGIRRGWTTRSYWKHLPCLAYGNPDYRYSRLLYSSGLRSVSHSRLFKAVRPGARVICKASLTDEHYKLSVHRAGQCPHCEYSRLEK